MMNRAEFLRLLALSPLAASTMTLNEFESRAGRGAARPRLPALFIGHGSPMNAIVDNPFTEALQSLGARFSGELRPTAVLVVSAHWLTRGSFVQAGARPETIHDFGGFPRALFDMQYPAPGAPELARESTRLNALISSTEDWGLDHGAWTILHHIFPAADVPVFQLSIDYHQPMQYHYDLARSISSLRDRGVLVLGSGNIVHNLRESFAAMARGDHSPADWALDFDAWTKKKLVDRDDAALLSYASHSAAQLAVPTVDHYVPMLYALGAATADEPVSFVHEEVYYAGLSMRSFRVGDF